MKNKEAKSIFSSLENYSSIPPPELWDKIEAQLDEPKKKKRAIIWWSIAASLAIGFSVPAVLYFNSNRGNGFELNIESNTNGVVLQKNSNEKNDKLKVNKGQNKSLNEKENNNDNLNSNQVAVSTVSNNFSKNATRNQSGNNGMVRIANNKSESNAIVSNQNSTSVVSNSESSEDKSIQVTNSNSGLSNKNNNNSATNHSNGIAENTISKAASISQSNASEKSLASNQNSDFSGSNNNKKGIVDNTTSKDSLAKINSEVAQLEKVLAKSDKDKTEKKEAPKNSDKWSLQVFAGVTSSQNFNNEKTLGNTVASKQSSGYGVKTNYKLNKKWGVSSGFKINELGQKIAGVSYYNNQQQASSVAAYVPISNTIYRPNSSTNYQLVAISNNSEYLFAADSKSNVGMEKGNVTQNFKYFEMPLEVSYSLLSKKKTNIIMNTGGFVGKLISNDIALNGTSIGENKNVNDFVYGTLLSSTMQYEFLKKTYFFIEPGMNYYINPLENQSFNQFQWMFNFGLNVKF